MNSGSECTISNDTLNVGGCAYRPSGIFLQPFGRPMNFSADILPVEYFVADL